MLFIFELSPLCYYAYAHVIEITVSPTLQINSIIKCLLSKSVLWTLLIGKHFTYSKIIPSKIILTFKLTLTLAQASSVAKHPIVDKGVRLHWCILLQPDGIAIRHDRREIRTRLLTCLPKQGSKSISGSELEIYDLAVL